MVATEDAELLLAAHPLVAPLHEEERAVLLDAVQVRRTEPGEVLIAEGDPHGELLLLLRGTVEVARDGREVALVAEGSWIGELSLLEGRASRTRARAVDEGLVGVVPPAAAHRALDLDAVALPLDSVAGRRRAANRALEVAPVTVATRDGGRALMRPLVPPDWRAYVEGQERGRVSERSLHMRFFTEPPRSERRFRELTDPDWRNAFAWTTVVDGQLAGVGRYALQSEDRSVAELALLVADDQQGRGLGSLLVEALVVTAAVHGADELYAVTREENQAIRHMLSRVGARWRSGDDVVASRWPLADALAALPDTDRVAAFERVAATVLAPVLDP